MVSKETIIYIKTNDTSSNGNYNKPNEYEPNRRERRKQYRIFKNKMKKSWKSKNKK